MKRTVAPVGFLTFPIRTQMQTCSGTLAVLLECDRDIA